MLNDYGTAGPKSLRGWPTARSALYHVILFLGGSLRQRDRPGGRSHSYLPTTTMEKESATIWPRPPPRPPAGGGVAGAGGAANSAVISRILLVLLSRVRVLARTGVCTVCSTTKVLGLFSLIT